MSLSTHVIYVDDSCDHNLKLHVIVRLGDDKGCPFLTCSGVGPGVVGAAMARVHRQMVGDNQTAFLPDGTPAPTSVTSQLHVTTGQVRFYLQFSYSFVASLKRYSYKHRFQPSFYTFMIWVPLCTKIFQANIYIILLCESCTINRCFKIATKLMKSTMVQVNLL